jgi:hypothetical protein
MNTQERINKAIDTLSLLAKLNQQDQALSNLGGYRSTDHPDHQDVSRMLQVNAEMMDTIHEMLKEQVRGLFG